MSIETMVTQAILEDKFTPVLNRIGAAQGAYERKTMAMNTLGNVFLAAGTAAEGFVAKSVEVAGRMDEVKKAMAAVEGQQKAAFDLQYVDQFAQHSKFTYLDLAEAAKRLALQNVSVKDTLGDMADVAAASGKPLQQVAQLYDALLGGGRVGLALSARGGFAQYGISAKEIFEAAGKTYVPGMKLQNAMTPQEVAAAVHKALLNTGRSGLNEKLATTTLSGSTGMLQDAMTRLEMSVGSGPLTHTIGLLGVAAQRINDLATAIKNVPNLGDTLAIGGAGLIVTGAVLKGVAAWRTYQAILKTAAAAGALERAGEQAKVGVAGEEAMAVAASTSKFTMLKNALLAAGAASLGESAAAASVTTVMTAGIATVGLYGVALAGLGLIIYGAVKAYGELADAQQKVADAQAANAKAISEGYDLKMGRPTGDAARPAWQNFLRSLANGGDTVFPDDPGGFTAMTDKSLMAKAARDGMAKHGVRAGQIAQAHAAAVAAAQAAAAKAAPPAEAGDPSLAMDYAVSHAERQLSYLEAAKAGQDKINAAKRAEIALLRQAAALYDAQAAKEADPRKKYALMDKADEDRYRALGLEADKKAKAGGFDKTISQILGGAGVGQDELTKLGLSRRLFATAGRGGLGGDPALRRVRAAARRPLVVNVNMDGRTLQTVRTQVVDEVLRDLISAGEVPGHVLPGGGL